MRPSWNKYNLYNLSRKQTPSIHNKTMFQQKWSAKKETRAYHGEHLSERQFRTIWDSKLTGVASDHVKDLRKIPLASQNYASLEKRLDTAIFRALFASSTRQAKQIVVHGQVRVNEVMIRNPGHILKHGDIIQVNPAAVIMNVSAPSSKSSSFTDQSPKEDPSIANEASNSEVATIAKSRRAKWEQIGQEQFVAKPFMSAFAFVPDYLEVSYETCSVVYLRDPVARPGSTEVPSPFASGVHALAANFYHRGR